MVADLGCGTSPYRDLILRRATRYVGVDWPSSFHGSSGVDVYGDISRAVPLRTASVDTVTAFQVLEHVREPALFLSECRRVLRAGGQLFIVVPFQWQVHEAPHDYYRYTRYGLEHLLTQAGFIDIDVQPTTGYWQAAALKFNYHTARRARGLRRRALTPLWWLTQRVAVRWDGESRNVDETASYVVRAAAPAHSVTSD